MRTSFELSSRALLLLTLTSTIFLQGTLSAPANFATARYANVEEQQEHSEHDLQGSWKRQVLYSLARSRNMAVEVSNSAPASEVATASPTSASPSSPSSDAQAPSSSLEFTRSTSEEDVETASSSEEPETSSTPSTTSSPSTSSSASRSTSTSSSSTSSDSTSSESTSSSVSTSSSSSTTSSSSSTSPSSILSSTSTSSSASSTSSIAVSSTSASSVTSSASTTNSSSLAPTSRPVSSALVSASTSNAAPSAFSTGKALRGCSCGFQISSFNNLYLRKSFGVDFRKYKSVAQLQDLGLTIADGYQIGNTAPDGTYVYGSQSNVKFGSDGVHLVVPGNQPAGGKVTGAQMLFNNGGKGMTRMWAEAMIRVDATPGTCQAFWTYTNDQSLSSDEQDMEVISASILTDSPVHEAGLQLTNHAPDKSGDKDHRTVPFPSDPTAGFHKYTIAWDRTSTLYYFDGQLLDGPVLDVSQNPSNMVFNHWASGNIGFSGAPLPNTTATMRVQTVKLYYETDFDSSLPSGCTQANVCVV